MAHLNLRDRLIETKIAYVGAADSGGADNLAHVKRDAQQGRAGAVEETVVSGGRVLSLAWRPKDGKLNDCELSVKLVSTHGAVAPDAMQSVLVDADGLVLVLESDPAAAEENERAVATVRDILARSPNKRVPVVVQVNRGEGEDPRTLDASVADEWPQVQARAAKGEGVMETLQRAVDVVVSSMQNAAAVDGAAPRPAGTPRAEGNPLLGALRQMLQATMSEQVAVLETRLLVRLEQQMNAREESWRALGERLAAFEARMGAIESVLIELDGRVRSATENAVSARDLESETERVLLAFASATGQHGKVIERLSAVESGIERVESITVEAGEHALAAAARIASKADVERAHAAIAADVKIQSEDIKRRLAPFDAWAGRIETTMAAIKERASAAADRAVSQAALDSLAARVVTEARRGAREDEARLLAGATQPVQRGFEALMAETKKWTDLATAIARCQVVSEGVREQLAPLIKESSALNARLDEVAAKLEHVDANVARRTTELGDSVRALAEDTETRSEVTRRELLVHIDELRKKKSFFG